MTLSFNQYDRAIQSLIFWSEGDNAESGNEQTASVETVSHDCCFLNTECLPAAAVKCSQCKQVSSWLIVSFFPQQVFLFLWCPFIPRPQKRNTSYHRATQRWPSSPVRYSLVWNTLWLLKNKSLKHWTNVEQDLCKEINRKKGVIVTKTVFIKEQGVWGPLVTRSLPVLELHVTMLVTLGHGKMWI